MANEARHCLTEHSPPARHALARLPENLTTLPLVKALASLVASVWDRKHANVYSRAEHLFTMVTQPDFLDPKLASVMAHMVTTFAGLHKVMSKICYH